MIVWCKTCQIEPMEVDSSETVPGECGYCFYNDYPQRYLVGYQNLDGPVVTEEVTQDEYFRICRGEGSTPKPTPMEKLLEFVDQLCKPMFTDPYERGSEVSERTGEFHYPETFTQ